MSIIEQNKKQILALLVPEDFVQKFYVFGSALTSHFNDETSDVDVLVEINNDLHPEERGEKLLSLWSNLEKLFGRKVDLLTENSLSNPYLKAEIDKTKKLIYDGQIGKIFI